MAATARAWTSWTSRQIALWSLPCRGILVSFVQRVEKLGQSAGPAALEVDVLRMRDQKRRLEGSKTQRNDEFLVADLARHVRGDLDFIADALFVDRARVSDEEDFGSSISQGVLELPLPIVATPQAQHIGPYLIAERGQFRAQPERERVVFQARHG